MSLSSIKLGYYHLTMKLKDYSFLLLLLFSISSFSQYKIEGVVADKSGNKLPYVEVYNQTSGTKTSTNNNGEFLFETNNAGTYSIIFYKDKFALLEQDLKSGTENYSIVLEEIINLSEVVINKQKEKVFALNKLKDIEGTAIYAGKKTEVISIDKLTANKATNNTRQIFSQVVGLTINETSDGGLQLSIGGRGLDPNRTANFNTRQNGYDISADVLGYPESYYAPPVEALAQIQVVRGAASLQYGTQFGGMVNFEITPPSLKPITVQNRTTVGNYNLFTNYTAVSGTVGKFSYNTFFNYKTGDGFRPNSGFDSQNYFANLNYQFNEKTSIKFDYTYFHYLAQQPGGLTDYMFEQDPTQSNRARNWFEVNWNLYALRFNHAFDNDADFSLQLFGLDASRSAVGYRSNRVSNPDIDGTVRDLMIGDFVNWGAEARYLKRYSLNDNNNAFLIGAKYYQAKNSSIQGPGSSGSDADFDLAIDEFPLYANQSEYEYPNLNLALFGENIFRFGQNFSITPGFRFEYIKTQADGYYRKINTDLAGNVILDETIDEDVVKERSFALFGVGLSYKPINQLEYYGNISQNYRSVTFNDIRTVSPSQVIAPDITDERGFTTDVGARGLLIPNLSFDASVFALYYNDKIGEYETRNPNGSAAIVRYRDNIGTAITYGFETMFEWNINNTFFKEKKAFAWSAFTNVAITDSQYLESDAPNIEGNKVEFVPLFNIKTGTAMGYKNFMASVQFTYLSSQYTDANNSLTDINDNTYGIFGQIPEYYVADFSCSYTLKNWKFEGGITNFTDNDYYTRRATGYPGPGIIPSDGRLFYTTVGFIF